MACYKGVKTREIGHGIERVFSWMDDAGKNWTTGLKPFLEHLRVKYDLPSTPSQGRIHTLLRAHGKAAFRTGVNKPKRHAKRRPVVVRRANVVATVEPTSAANGEMPWASAKGVVSSLLSALPDTPTNRALVARIGMDLWGKLAGLKG